MTYPSPRNRRRRGPVYGGASDPRDAYRVGSSVPTMVGHFTKERYLTGSGAGNFASLFTFSRSDPATMNDANGNFVTVAANVPRVGHHVWDGSAWVDRGLLTNPVSVTNLLEHALGSSANWSSVGGATLTDLSLNALNLFPGLQVASAGATFHRAQAAAFTLSAGDVRGVTVFYRAGTSGQARITLRNVTESEGTTLSGAAGLLSVTEATAGGFAIISQKALPDGTFVISGAFTTTDAGSYRLSFGPNSSVSGDTAILLGAQVDSIGVPTQLIVSNGSPTTRSADSLSIASAVLGSNGFSSMPTAFSVHILGRVSYEQDGGIATVKPLEWQVDNDNQAEWRIATDGGRDGRPRVVIENAGVFSVSSGADDHYSPGVDIQFSMAARHAAGTSALRGANEGTFTGAVSPAGIPDLTSANMQFFNAGAEATIELIRIWPEDIADAGVQEASTV